MNLTKFWVVWNPSASAPRFRHGSKIDAEAEALRLAAQHPGHQFIVLKAVGGAVCTIIPPEPIKFTAPDTDDIPF